MGLAKFSLNFAGWVSSSLSLVFFFTRLRKSQGPNLSESISRDVLCSHLKHFEVLVSQFKTSECLRLAKKKC